MKPSLVRLGSVQCADQLEYQALKLDRPELNTGSHTEFNNLNYLT